LLLQPSQLLILYLLSRKSSVPIVSSSSLSKPFVNLVVVIIIASKHRSFLQRHDLLQLPSRFCSHISSQRE
jgi:hypothetical protein